MYQLAFVFAHVPLALAIPRHSRLGTLYGLAVFAFGLVATVLPRRPDLVACAIGYMAGGATFWRMKASPNLPWEFGKYGIIALCGIALVFSVRIRRPLLAILYAAFLIPSVFVTITWERWEETRSMLSFNMTGPITLAFTVMFFSSVRLTPAQLRWVMVSVLAPTVAIATVAAQSLQKALEDPDFGFYGGASNSATSGGFGPNQVSAALGLGILAVIVYLMLGVKKRLVIAAMFAVILFLIRQCLVTLSRGGIYMAMGGLAAASFFLMKDNALRKKLIIAVVLSGLVVGLVIIPRLQEITGGVLVSRFENTSGTGRDLLMKADMQSWSESPLLGVGPGRGDTNRLKYFHAGEAHTEYTRMLAEHGLLGLVSLVALVLIAVRCVREPRGLRSKAFAAAFVTYAVLFMAVNGTRLAAPAFAFGLGSVTIAVPARRARSPMPPPAPRWSR
jgi:O-antigen ligase